MSLDQQFEEKSQQCGISVAKLKTVYFRGVEEYHALHHDMGTPMMWGLARVQRFINCITRGLPLTNDDDLLATKASLTADCGIDIAVDASAVLSDVLYSTGAQTAAMFQPGDVQSILVEDDIITVDGTLDGKVWSYSLDTISGEHKLYIW